MARSTITVQSILLSTASAPGYTAVDTASGMQWANDGTMFVHLINTGASALTANFLANTAYAGVIFPTYTAVAPSALAGIIFGPFAIGIFNQSDGNTYCDFSGNNPVSVGSGTKIAILSLPLTAT